MSIEPETITHHIRRIEKRLRMMEKLSDLVTDSVTEASLQLAAMKHELGLAPNAEQPELPLPEDASNDA